MTTFLQLGVHIFNVLSHYIITVGIRSATFAYLENLCKYHLKRFQVVIFLLAYKVIGSADCNVSHNAMC